MTDQTEQGGLITQFVGITSCGEQQARFYLEATNWDLDAAIGNYYEEPNAEQTNVEPEVTASGSRNTGGPFGGTNSTTAPRSSFATLHDLDKEQSEEEDEDEERENLFAGGEKSGIFMQNPNAKPTRPSNSLVSDILKKAAESGRGPAEELEATTSTEHSSFSGTGYKLGGEDEPSVIINNPTTSTASVEPPPTVVRHLTFWRNGFSIEDGPLMAYDDPANEDFLKAINSGRAPLAWLNVRQDQPVDVRVARRLDEDYKPPPKKPSKPFSGSGQRLGSPTPTVITSSTPGAYPSTSSSHEPAPPAQLEIDESLPITSIQIRLGDGTRMLSRFNHTHTIGDIRNFINASRVGEAQRNYILQTTFPSRDLKDEKQTLLDASLLNSVVVQRYI
uniref:UBX domain-containing protein 1 n=1 Tax=Anthurium amnicola TaxID=1678845 RepID=A0A1D1XUV3_9ARAE